MGVPSYFRELIKKYPHIVQRDPNISIKALYIDANCLFHPQCFKILDQYIDLSGEQLFKKMVQRILDYIDYLIKFCNPTELVYIAVDGVAPLAKVNQQRFRRFGYADNYKHRIYAKHSIPFNSSWSNIQITPGTEFMYKLHQELLKHYSKSALSNAINVPYDVIYDSYLTAGEGEHKILQHMKNVYANCLDKQSIVVYGLDADLIFLTMASRINSIYLLRESGVFNGNDDQEIGGDVQEDLLFVDIDVVKESINLSIEDSSNHLARVKESNQMFDDDRIYTNESIVNSPNINKSNLILRDGTYDYIFICYFLGNDFLPHLPSIDIKNGGLHMVLGCYLEIYEIFGCPLIEMKEGKVSINNMFLREFIKLLQSNEEDYFREILPDQLHRHNRKRCFEHEPHKKDIWMIENLKNVQIDDPIKLGYGSPSSWKYRYYSHYFKTEENQQHTIREICHNYIEGLLWVSKYYFEKCESWKWQYKYTHPPFLSDISEYLNEKDVMKDFNIPLSNPLNMYVQLSGVIPAVYSEILPKNLRFISTSPDSPVIDMFPTTYQTDMINKTQLYKCVPIIPHIDLERLENVINMIKLSNDEMKRAEPNQPFVFKTIKKEIKKTEKKKNNK
jgi:5'-3' exonuclease